MGGVPSIPFLGEAEHRRTEKDTPALVCCPPRGKNHLYLPTCVQGCRLPEAALNLRSDLKAPGPLGSGRLPSPLAV